MLIQVDGGYVPSERVKFVRVRNSKETYDNITIETTDGECYRLSGDDKAALEVLQKVFSPIIPAPPGYEALTRAKGNGHQEFWVDRDVIVAWRLDLEYAYLIPVCAYERDYSIDALSPDGKVSDYDHSTYISFDEWRAAAEKEWRERQANSIPSPRTAFLNRFISPSLM
jgi:hypothetical protein